MAMSEVFNLDFKFGGNAEFLVKLESLLQRIDSRFDSFEDDVKESTQATDKMADAVDDLNDSFKEGVGAMSSFGEKLKDIAQYYLSFQAIRAGAERVWSFGMQSMDAFATQERAENQLKGVMKNRGNLDQFQTIKDYAAEIQGRSIYGDEAMIRGAGELATYVKGTGSLKSMMDLLTDYAAGMTGGGEVSPEQMESLATGLGMAYDGNYMAMRRKGFDTSKLEALDAIVENGGVWGAKERQKYGDVLDEDTLKKIREYKGVTEQMRVDALQESLKDWKGLSNEVNKLDSSALIRFNNKLGDLRENIGKRLYPTFNRLVDSIDKHMPDIEEAFGAVAEMFETMANALEDHVDDIKDVISTFAELLKLIARYPKATIAAGLGFKVLTSGALTAAGGFGTFSQQLQTNITQVGNLNSALAVLVGGVAGYQMTDAEKLEGSGASGVGGVLGGVAMGALAGAKAFGVFGAAAGAAAAAVGAAFRSIMDEMDALHDKRENEKNWNEKSKGFSVLQSLQKQAIAARKRGDFEEAERLQGRLQKNIDVFEGRWGEGSAGTGFRMTVAGGAANYEKQKADAARKAQQDAKKQAKGDMFNTYNTTNNYIEQKVNVAAEVEKIGMLLNFSVRAAIEQAMRQNKNQVAVGAI
jgi:hypothetical protein